MRTTFCINCNRELRIGETVKVNGLAKLTNGDCKVIGGETHLTRIRSKINLTQVLKVAEHTMKYKITKVNIAVKCAICNTILVVKDANSVTSRLVIVQGHTQPTIDLYNL